jgi:hypothetical protein
MNFVILQKHTLLQKLDVENPSTSKHVLKELVLSKLWRKDDSIFPEASSLPVWARTMRYSFHPTIGKTQGNL